jgi:hypothetical protein
MDHSMDTTISMPYVRPYDECAAGLAAPMALVCSAGNCRSFIPPLHFAGIRRFNWHPIRQA